MNILAIDTSADETSAAVVSGRKVLSHIEYSQIATHTNWGGIVPSIAKRAHEERIDFVVEQAVNRAFHQMKLGGENFISGELGSDIAHASNIHPQQNFAFKFSYIDAIAVTYGPGLAIALEVGIRKAKELAQTYGKKLIAINHMEGHIYSCFVENSKGNPVRTFQFPYLCLLVSGGHTEFVLLKNHLDYEVLGETRDDAAGEALDKAARMLGLGYPGGPVIERLAKEVKNEDRYSFPRPLASSKEIEFSFSGLKTSFFYFLKQAEEKEKIGKMKYLASSFQEAVLDSLLNKIKLAVQKTGVTSLVVGGGVSANKRLRLITREFVKKVGGTVYFPPYPYLTGDNAAMIGVVASYKAEKGEYIKDINAIDRVPRLSLKKEFIEK